MEELLQQAQENISENVDKQERETLFGTARELE